MKILCVFGKHQYGTPSRGVGTEYAAFVPALSGLGHEVVHFESWDRTCHRDFAELNKRLLETVETERPDVMLAVQTNYELWLETLQVIANRGDVATICWTTDDSWKYRQVSRFLGSAFHAMTTTYPQVVPKYHRDGISKVLLTQWAANSEHLHPPQTASSCRHSVTFVGAAHGSRPARVAALKEMGVEIACFGHGWPSGSVSAEKIPGIMRESVISLNFANSSGENQIKARTFEVPGAGGFLLTESASDLPKFYRVGKEIDCFDSLPELAKKVRYYLANPDHRDQIAQAGFAKTRDEHTYERRLDLVLKFALQAKDEFLRRPRAATRFDEALRRHSLTTPLKLLRSALVRPCQVVWGNTRGQRAARRLVFELSWRVSGKKAFSAAGWAGRMFPEQ